MGKYEDSLKKILSIFSEQEWLDQNIQTIPNNFVLKDKSEKYIRVKIITPGKPINIASVSGIVMIDIYTLAGKGPLDAVSIADKLDIFLSGRYFDFVPNASLQFFESAMEAKGVDQENPSMYKSIYSIPFKYNSF